MLIVGFVVIVIAVALILSAIMYAIIFITSPPKEKCSNCGEDIYPIELNNGDLYKECEKCGHREIEQINLDEE